MPRKRLSDIVREGVKSEENPDNSSLEVKETEPKLAPTAEEKPKRTTKIQLEEKIEISAEVQPGETDKIELEEKIQELKLALDQANQQAKNLQGKITVLEKELTGQKGLVATLQSQLNQADEYKRELEEQKQLVEKLSFELEQFQSQNNEQLLAENKPQSQELIKQEVFPSSIYARPIASYSLPLQPAIILSNEEIGWFD